MWVAGKTANTVSLGPSFLVWPETRAFHIKLLWVSITPLGALVVPVVYINAATWVLGSVVTGSAETS